MNKFRLMSFFVILAMLFGFANVSPASATSSNLIVNGSFEDPQLPVGNTWQYTYGISTSPVSPWLPWPGPESYPFALASGAASDGNQWFNFASNSGGASFYQSVSTVGGVQHTLSFDYKYNGRGPTCMNTLVYHASNVTSYANTNLTANTTYRYRVYAYNASGNSGYSNVPTATTRRR